MLTRTLAALAMLIVLIGSALLPPTQAYAAPVGCVQLDAQSSFCSISGGGSGTGDGAGAGTRDPYTGFTSAPPVCYRESIKKDIDCNKDGKWWNDDRQCYVELSEYQNADGSAVDGETALPNGAAFYACYSLERKWCGDPPECYDIPSYNYASVNPPPGMTTLTPSQAAWRIVESFELNGINIAMAPDPGVAGSRGYVGLPVWMWAASDSPVSYTPAPITLGGVTITIDARVDTVDWNMGDGTAISCSINAPAYNRGFGIAKQPGCGHLYTDMSSGQPGGRFPITATSRWNVGWTGGGEAGTIPVTGQTATSVEIRELQSVNVGN